MSEANCNASKFCPEGELTIYTAEEQKLQLLKAIAGQNCIEVDLSKITEMDTAGLQLLILAKLESRRRAVPLTMVGHSQAVLEVIDICNMSSFFGDPVLLPSENSVEGAR